MMKRFGVPACRLIVAAAIVLSTALPAAAARVRFPNLNFSITYTDINDSTGPEDYMNIIRVYNSLTEFSGIFGYGWGTEQESNLLTRADGTLQYTAFGGGATTELTPSHSGPAASAIPAMLGAASQTQMVGSDAELQDFESSVKDDDTEMIREYTQFLQIGVLRPAETAVGEMFSGNVYGAIRVMRVPEGFEMFKLPQPGCDTCPPFEGLFDRRGRMLRAWEHAKPEHFVAYRYDDTNDELDEMHDYRGNRYVFTYDRDGHVVRIVTKKHQVSQYRYNGANLVWQKDADGHVYTYSYDSEHDLTEIGYPDKPPMRMVYPKGDGVLGGLTCSDGRTFRFVKLPGSGPATFEVTESKGTEVVKKQEIAPADYGSYGYC